MWTPIDEGLPEEGERVGIYDAFHVGLSTARFDGEEFEVEDDGGRGTFVTHWTRAVPPSGSPDSEDVHRVCKQQF